jgi:class 3 adenylate cyclase
MLSSAERRLTAIMFTDVVGYSAMTQRNEELALELLQLHREMLRPIFRSLGGNEIKTIGDAFLVEFQSALQAARCAIAIQRELRQYNGSVNDDRQINVRIGLHIGDVVFESNDVYGDGVNLASRIYTQAQPGEIIITRSVYDQIYNKIDLSIRRLGLQRLKSIQKPVELFCIDLDERERYHFSPTSAASISTLGVVSVLIAAYFIWGGNVFNTPESSDNTDSLIVVVPDTTGIPPIVAATLPTQPDTTVATGTDESQSVPIRQAPSQNTNTTDPLNRFRSQYASLTASGNWYNLQRALRHGTDTGTLAIYASRDSLSSMEGVLAAVIDATATDSSLVDAFLVYTNSRFVNLATREEISTLTQRYSGKRVIWVRSLK